MQKNNLLKVFQLFPFLLFWRDNRSQISQYLFEFLSNLQLISIIVTGRYFTDSHNSNEALNIFFQKAFKMLSTFDLLSLNTDTFLLNFLLVTIWIYFATLALLFSLICWKYRTSKMIHNTLKICLTYWAQFHHTIVFWIINTFLISRTVNVSFEEINTFKGISNILLITLNFLVALISSLYCYDPFNTRNEFSSFNSMFQISTFFFKMIMTLIFIFIEDKAALKWTFLIASFIITAIRYELLLRWVPYYKYHALKFTAGLAGCAFFLSSAGLFIALFDQFGNCSTQIWGYIELLGTSFSLKLTGSRIDSMIAQYASIEDHKLLSVGEVLKKLFALTYIIKKANFVINFGYANTHNLASIYLQAELNYHKKNCRLERCLCKFLLKQKVSNNDNQGIYDINKASMDFLISLKNNILARAVERFKNNNDIKLLLAYLIFRKPKTLPKALFLIFEIKKSKVSFKQKILLKFISIHIEDYFSEISKNSRDLQEHKFFEIKRIVDYQNKANELNSFIERYFSEYMELWDYYQKPNMMLAKFFQKTITLERQAENIQTIWNDLLKLNKCVDMTSTFCYELYLKSLRSASNKANGFCNQSSRSLKDPIELNQSNQIIVCVSMAKDKLGKVLQISRNVNQEFGWSQNCLIGNDMKNIQPPYLRERHNIILHEYIENINKLDSFTSFSKESFLQSKEGFLVPVNVYVTIYPVVLNEPIYVGIINKREMDRAVMVIRSDGFVDCFSEEIGLILNLNLRRKTHISQICQNFNEINFNLFEKRQSVDQSDTIERECENINSIDEFAHKEFVLKFNIFSQLQKIDTEPISLSAKIQKYKILKDVFILLFIDSKNYFYKTKETYASPNEIIPCLTQEDPLLSPTASLNPLLQSSRIPDSNRETYLKSKGLSGRLEQKVIQDFVPSSNISDKNEDLLINTRRQSVIQAETFRKARPNIERKETEPNNLMQRENLIFKEKGINFKNKLEEAIYCVPQERSSKILNYAMIIFILVCLALVVMHLVQVKQLLDISLSHIDLISVAQKRSYKLSEIYAALNVLTLIKIGMIPETRHVSLGITSYTASRKGALKQNAQELILANNQIRNNMDFLVQDQALMFLKERFDVKGQVRGENLKQKISSFDLVTEISNAAILLSTTSLESINENNPAVEFVRSNSLNDLLLENDHFTQILVEDTKRHLTSIKSTLINYLIIITMGIILFLVILSFNVRKLIKKRDKIIELLLTIDEVHLQTNLKQISNVFQKVSNQKIEECKNPTINTPGITDRMSVNQTQEAKRIPRKIVNRRGLNNRLKWTVIFTIFCILSFSSIFMVLSITYTKDEKKFLLKIDNMTEVNELLTDLSLLFTISETYIGSLNKPVFVRNRPIEEEIDEILKNVRKIPTFFSSLVTEDKVSKDSNLNDVMVANLCKVIDVQRYPIRLCPILGGGVITEGLIRLLAFLVKGIEDSINIYKSSNQTFEAAKLAINTETLVVSEQISVYATKGYELIQYILKEKLRQLILDKHEEILWTIMVYILVYLILGSLLSLDFWKKINKERDDWRKLLRHIPTPIILNNSQLRNYLINNSENILDSIKHIL